MSEATKKIKFVVCSLGGHKRVNTSPGHLITIEEDGKEREAWACQPCIRKAQIEAMTLTEDLPLKEG